VNGLAFLSPGAARADEQFVPRMASPLARALAGATGMRDLSLLCKVELRGSSEDGFPAGVEVIRITPHRTLLVWDADELDLLVAPDSGLAIDLTGALAGIELEGETLMRRLTDLDLSRLPAAGKVAGVPAIVGSSGDGLFRVFFAQELGHSVVEAVRDVQDGLA
jgi:hypothetical protein